MRRPEQTFIRTNTELYEFWQEAMGPGGFAYRSVWLVFLADDGQVQPVIVPIDDVPPRPETEIIGNLKAILTGLIEDGPVDTVAALFARPGPAAMTDDDREWGRSLSPLTPRWPVHLATRGLVRVFAGDDLVAA
jgi:hypothetical protein